MALREFLLPWDSQPQEAPSVDWSNPLANGLVRLIAFNLGAPFDLVTGQFLTQVGGGATRSATSRGVATTNTDETTYWTLPVRSEAHNRMSVGWLGSWNSGTASVVLRDATPTGGNIILWRNAGFDLRIGGGDYTSAGTWNAGQIYGVVVTSAGANGKIFVDGRLTVSAGSSSFNSLVSPWYLHQNGTAANGGLASSLALAIWDRPLSDAEASSYSIDPWQLFAPRSIWVPVSASGGSATNLTIQDATHSHTADSLTVSLGYVDLTIADATHAHAADSLTLSIVTVTDLTIADATHAHTADSPTLTTSGAVSLTIQDATHGHTADAPTLTLGYVDLVIAQALHGHTADSLTLTVSGSVDLLIANALHAHLADTPTLSPGYIDLTIADALHAHAADNLTLGFPSDAGVLGSLAGSARPKEPNRENPQTATRLTNSQTATRRNVQTATR